MTTVATLITEIRGLLNEPSTASPLFFDDDEISGHIDRAIKDLCIETDINYRRYTYTSTAEINSITLVGLTGGSETQLLKMKWLLYYKPKYQYWYDLFRQIPLTNINEAIASSTAFSCEIYDNTIFFNNPLEYDVTNPDKIIIGGRWMKPSITKNSTFPLDAFAEDACVKFALSMSFLKAEKTEQAKVWMDLYIQRKQQIKDYYDQLIQSSQPAQLSNFKNSSNKIATVLGNTIPNPLA